MGIIPLHRWAMALVLLLLAAVASGQPGKTVAVESTLISKMRQADARLNVPVTFKADRMYLGELLERLSLQTHVALSMDENDRLSGVPITCDLKQLPLAEVMDSLTSLLGARNAAWDWKADAVRPPICYSLRPTQAARNLADQTDKKMRDTLDTLVNGIIRLAFLPPEERDAQVENYIASVSQENPDYAKTYVFTSLRRETYWKGVRLFADVLSPDQRRRVLQGEEIDISLASMSEEDRELALTLEGADNRNFLNGVLLPTVRIWPAALKTIEPGMAIRIQEDLVGMPGEKYYRYSLQYATSKRTWTYLYGVDLPCVPPKPAPEEIGLR